METYKTVQEESGDLTLKGLISKLNRNLSDNKPSNAMEELIKHRVKQLVS